MKIPASEWNGFGNKTPADFRAMPAHMQTEAVLLGRERGLSFGALARGYRVPVSEIIVAGAAWHEYRAVSDEEVRSSPERAAARERPLSPNAEAVLLLIHRFGGRLQMSTLGIEGAAMIGDKKGPHALSVLVVRGLIEKLQLAGGGRPAEWGLTAEGEDLAGELAKAVA